MAKFSLVRIPYYIAVCIFCGLAAIVASFANDTATGSASDFYLVLTAIFGGLAGWSGFFLITSLRGQDDDIDLEVAGLPASKAFFYFGVLATAAYRAFGGFQMNHNATGFESFYGKVWLLASLALAIFTWANYRSFQAKKTAPAANPYRI